ncbi:MAG: lysophospholipid acyltransferase family protein [Brumimicrobium sp.]|nr:lysophospholipid acyltransferase family protein [Brumimicrobium sp.]
MKYILFPFKNIWKLHIGIVFVITLLLFYPFFLLILSSEKTKSLTFKLNIVWSRMVRILCFYAIEIEGDYSKKPKPFILVANHTSYLDIFLMYSLFPKNKFLFMGKSEILSYPLVKTFFKRLNIPVHRENRLKAAKSFIQAKNALSKGWSIVIFPEGRIPDQTPYLIPFKEGAFQLAKAAQTGIQALTFANNYYLFSDPEDVFKGARPGLVRVFIHPFISEEVVTASTTKELNLRSFNLINSRLPKKIV